MLSQKHTNHTNHSQKTNVWVMCLFIYYPISVYIQGLLNILQTSEKENITNRQLRLARSMATNQENPLETLDA